MYKMKNFVMFFAVLAAVMMFVVSCGKSNNASTDKFTLIVGFDASFPPYGFQNEDGELVGFDLDLAAEVAKRQGWGIKLRPIDWDAKDAELSSGTINCIWNGFTITPERETQYTWSKPYVNSAIVVMVRKNSGIAKIADLAGKIVEAQADSSGLAAITDDKYKDLCASFKKLIEVPDYNQAHMELQSGACDAVVIDESVAKGYLKDDDKCAILDEPVNVEQYGIGFKLGNVELRDKVQASLDEMLADGTFKTISEKWFEGIDMGIYDK